MRGNRPSKARGSKQNTPRKRAPHSRATRLSLNELLAANKDVLSVMPAPNTAGPSPAPSKRGRGRPAAPTVDRVEADLALIAHVILYERQGMSTTAAFDAVQRERHVSVKSIQHSIYRRLGGMRAAVEQLDDDGLRELAGLPD